MTPRLGFWWPDRLAGRLALTIVAALFATQTISVAVLFFVRPPPPQLFSAAWLAEVTSDLVAAVWEVSPPERASLLAARSEATWFSLAWQRERPETPGPGQHPSQERLRTRIEQALKVPVDAVLVGGGLRGPGPTMLGPMPRLSGRGPERPPAPSLDDLDLPVLAPFTIAVRGNDGTWLVLSALVPGESIWRLVPFAAWLMSAGLVVTILSLLAASRLLAPLQGLARATERMGLDRAAAPVVEQGPREIRVIVRAFNRMQDRLRRFVDDRTEMLASISHDLRTPLTRLRLRLELSSDSELRRAALADVEAMQAMVAETLSFAVHDAHRETARPTDFAVLVAGVCDDLADAGHDVRYRGPPHLTLLCQPVGMRRAIANLVDNAVKFGGKARVVLTPDGEEVAVSVLDRGPGIPEDEFDRVFRPFYRLAPVGDDAVSGAGLGLAVARNILRAHGGDVTLRRRRVRGLVATAHLPGGSST